MALYRRFVTYLFRYEQEKKEANCGFAKVEIRQDQCRMELQIKGYEDGTYAVYLFVNEENRMEGVHIGDIRLKNGVGKEVFLFVPERIGGTSYDIDEVGGVYITVDHAGFIASQWNDEEVRWSSFRVHEESAGEETQHGQQESFGSEKLTSEESDAGKNMTEEVMQKGIEESEAEEKSAKEKNAEEKSDPTDKGGVINSETEKMQITENEMTERSDAKGIAEGNMEKTDAGKIKISKESGENETEKIENGEGIRIQNKEDKNTGKKPMQAPSELKATQAGYASQISSYTSAWERQWQHFTALHPVFQPFDEEQNIYAIKIELRDFKALPKQYWSLTNNSFLLHGYFNYKYLLFGYMDGDKKRWFLGVPGSFQNQEQLLAGIFGFTEFKTKHQTKQKTGEFGFWYRYLDL